MANNNERNFLNASQMAVGQSITGKVAALPYDNTYNKTDILLEDNTGTQTLIRVSGSLKDATANGDIAEGQTITITRNANYNGTTASGKNYTKGQFTISAAQASGAFAKKANGAGKALPKI